MKIIVSERNQSRVMCVSSETPVITDVQTALDLMVQAKYEYGCSKLLLERTAVCDDFFRLTTTLAGQILQKFINYQVKLAIIGDFTAYSTQNLQDFFYESNQGKDVFFLPTEEDALKRLHILAD